MPRNRTKSSDDTVEDVAAPEVSGVTYIVRNFMITFTTPEGKRFTWRSGEKYVDDGTIPEKDVARLVENGDLEAE